MRVAAQGRLAASHVRPAFQGPVAATIFYFPSAAMQGDIDNIVKPILDALVGVASAHLGILD